MPVRLNSSGGGSVTLDVPATGTTTTLTLPITGGGIAASGAIGSSGLTMNTSRLLGRTTAGSGAVEEITVGTGLSLTGGTLATSGGSQLQEQLFVSSGSWTAPAGVTRVQAIVIGGGGGGPAGYFYSGGFGGVATGLVTVVPGTTYTITVGAGGSGGAGQSGSGSAGGTSSFGAFMSATGGAGGIFNVNSVPANGSGSNGTTRNSNVGSVDISPFSGTSVRGGSTAPSAWSSSLALRAGASGSVGGNDCSGNYPGSGGVGGLIYLQWVG